MTSAIRTRLPERKTALCVGINDLVAKDSTIGAWHLFVMDRALVDNKDVLMPQIKQLLPYITFVSSKTKSVLTYSRGKNTTEVRLRARSIGFGGHVDTAPDAKHTPPYISSMESCFLAHLVEEALREIREELPGFLRESSVSELYRLRQYLGNCMADWRNHAIDIRYAEVDSVHLGFSLVIDIDEFINLFDVDALTGEENQVVDIRWEKAAALTTDTAYLNYEGWSQYVLWRLFPDATYLASRIDILVDAEPIPRFGVGLIDQPKSIIAGGALDTTEKVCAHYGVNI